MTPADFPYYPIPKRNIMPCPDRRLRPSHLPRARVLDRSIAAPCGSNPILWREEKRPHSPTTTTPPPLTTKWSLFSTSTYLPIRLVIATRKPLNPQRY